MSRWRYALAALPAGLGLLSAALAVGQAIANPVLYLRGSLAALMLLGGGALSAGAGMHLWFRARRQAKQSSELQRLQQAALADRRRFLQRLDHELKNPLTAIQAGLANLSEAGLGAYPGDEVAAIKTQVLRVSRLVADLRKLAALETSTLERTVVNTAELLNEVVGVFENQARLQGRRLALSLPTAPRPLPEVSGDPDLLLLAIHNLVDNAVKFTASGDTIEVRASENGNEVMIEVADTGPGIAPAELDLVWEELYRAEQARGVPGSGLGLPLVRAIIEKHGGSVGLRSLPGQGTVFSLRLPARN